jgi:hypothetical protein
MLGIANSGGVAVQSATRLFSLRHREKENLLVERLICFKQSAMKGP